MSLARTRDFARLHSLTKIGELARRLRAKGRGASSPFLPLRVLNISSFVQKNRNRRLARRLLNSGRREIPLIVGLPPLDFRLQVSRTKSEKYWAGLFFSQNAFPHSWSNLAPHGIMDALQLLSKSFQHGGRNGCNAFSQSEKHREERRTGSQSPQDQSRWGDNRYFWLEGKLQGNFALKNFKSLSCGCTWRHLLIENLDLFGNAVRRNTLSVSDNY